MARHSSPSQLSLTNILQNNLDDIRNAVVCRICIKPMYEPYTTQCGHTFCYRCLCQWFNRDHARKTCPDCRSHVLHQPAPAYLVRDITQLFISTAALLPNGETTEDHKKFQKEEAEHVEKDRNGPRGLFNARFKPAAYRPPIRDGPDGVDRCPMCTWELEAGMCNSCGYTTLHHAHFTDDDSISIHSDMYSMDSIELEEMLTDPANAHALAFESDDPELNQPHPRMIEAMRHRFRSPRYYRRPDAFGSDADAGFSEETDSVGSLADFVDDVPEMEVDNASGRMSDYPSDSEQPTSSVEESHFERSLTPAHQRVQRRRVASSSPEPSDSGFSTITQSSHRSSQHSENDMPRSRFSPEQQIPDRGHSQDILIQVDSDSDTPPLRRPRRRRAAVPISSDEDDSDTQEVNAPHSRTSQSSSEQAARTGGRRPPSSAARRNHHLARVGVGRPRAPILIDSSPAPSPAPPNSSRLARPHPSARHRRILSETTADESADQETHMNESSRIPQQRTPTSPPSEEATDGQRPRPQLVDLEQQPGQPDGPAESQTSSRMTPDQRQHQARMRLKQERRRRRQQEQRANPMGPPRQLAYIGV